MYNNGTQVCTSFGMAHNPTTTSDWVTSASSAVGACGTSNYFVRGVVYSLWNGVHSTSGAHTNLCCAHNL